MGKLTKSRQFEIVERNLERAKRIIEKVKEDYRTGYVTKYAYALHDKDTYTTEEINQLLEDTKNDKERFKKYEKLNEGDLKQAHYHIGFQLKNATSFGAVAGHYQCETNMVTTIKSHYFKDYLTYLVHGNRPAKYQYPLDVVKTSESDYKRLINQTITSYFSKNAKDAEAEYLERIRNGEWTLKYISQLSLAKAKNEDDKWLCAIYEKHKKAVEQAYQTYLNSIMDFTNINRRVFFVQGQGGNGKTNYVQDWFERNHINQDNVYETGENDPLGRYQNEDVVVFDDFRPNSIKFTQLLNCTDPRYAHVIDARFFDRKMTSKFVFITSSMSIEEWVQHFRRYKPQEDMNQFVRRISYLVDVQLDYINTYVNKFENAYNSEVDEELKIKGKFIENHFQLAKKMKNPVAQFDKSKMMEDLSKPTEYQL